MIQSFLVYFGMMCIMTCLAHSARQFSLLHTHRGRMLSLGGVLLIILIFGVVFGARWEVGIDHSNYLSIYESYGKGFEERDSLEPGFVFINKLLASNGIHFFFYFFSFAAIQIGFLILAFQHKKYLLPFALFVLMTGQFIGWMNIIRQETVVCVFIWLILTIERQSFLSYSFWITVCVLCFHKSAFILLFFYPFIKNRKSYTGTLYFQIPIFFVAFFMGYTHYVLTRFVNIEQFALLIGYEQYAYPDLAERFFKVDFNWGVRSWINMGLAFASVVLSPKVKNYCKDKAYVSVYNFFFWGTCCMLICTGIDVISRLFTYFSAMNLIIYTYTLYYVYKCRGVDMLSMMRFLGYAFLNILVFAGTLYAVTLPESATKFLFFWQK